MAGTVFVFLDESGDLGFSEKGSRFFVLSAVSLMQPHVYSGRFDELRYRLLESGREFERFHCSDNPRPVRTAMFDLMNEAMPQRCVDCLVIEKRKAGTGLQGEMQFYPRMVGYLLRHVLQASVPSEAEQVVIVSDTPPINRRRDALDKATRGVLAATVSRRTPYRLLHHRSHAHMGLQIADYYSWAVFQKWEHNRLSEYEKIRGAIGSEFEIFRRGQTFYY